LLIVIFLIWLLIRDVKIAMIFVFREVAAIMQRRTAGDLLP